tara:strand:- start:1462 stop:2154 length:693 start_codon:yes stop_codon:yes gene_type:complete
MKRALGIITARGGSKGVPRKNIRIVAGHPLISYTVKSALESNLLDEFVTSTDNDEIADIAAKYGSPILLRPEELAQDHTPHVPVIQHVIRDFEERGKVFDNIVILQPTSPQRTGLDIDNCLELLSTTRADTIVSVYKVDDHHPARMYTLVNGYLVKYDVEPEDRQRHSLPDVYHRNGAVYALKANLVTNKNTIYGDTVCPYIMPRSRSVNIDNETDLALAEVLLSKNITE